MHDQEITPAIDLALHSALRSSAHFLGLIDAKRDARQYAKFPDALRGAIVGAPADPEAFG